ncbi:hypothetical protein [Rickettsiella massiliensis]|uniref:hypothetical protein n=1 Tax=Rickettsiella massiliensis TaxID=676517 RepID=UPI00029B1D2C|nr:hypothetical protein [Rickettsiella massiliensis]
MANVSLNQFVCLRQPASDYLSQCYQTSSLLKSLIEELKAFLNSKPGLLFDDLTKSLEMLLESFQIGVEEAHSAIDVDVNPYPSFLSLNVSQTQGQNLLREVADDLTQLKHMLLEAADELDTYNGFEPYAKEFTKILSNKNQGGSYA